MRPFGGRKLGPSCPDGIHSFPLCFCGGFSTAASTPSRTYLQTLISIRLDVIVFNDESRIQQFVCCPHVVGALGFFVVGKAL